MSTASPLPLQPLPSSIPTEDEARALKHAVAERLASHRKRRPLQEDAQPTLPMEGLAAPHRRVADSVAARFARSVSYSDFLKEQAENAVREAEAAAEIARRNADAIAAAQLLLIAELDARETATGTGEDSHAAIAEVIAFAKPQPEDGLLLQAEPHAAADDVTQAASVPASSAAAMIAEVCDAAPPVALAEAAVAKAPADPEPRRSLAERLGLHTGPAEPSVALPTNLIEFPRTLVAARKVRPRLAEGPLREESDRSPEHAQLRIFEVEADAVSTEPMAEGVLPEWHGIRLDAHASPRAADHTETQISFAPPMFVAPVSLRLMALAVDGCCVFTGFLLAVAAAAFASPVLPAGISAAVASAVTLFIFAVGYQLLFFSLGDATPGMRYARIGFCTFSDENPSRPALRRRIGAQLLAGIPMGLGLLWACMDEEGLAWHDRMSRTYPRAY